MPIYSRGMYFLYPGPNTKSPQSIMQGKFLVNSETTKMLSPKTCSVIDKAKEVASSTKEEHERPHVVNEIRPDLNGSTNNNSSAPAAK